MRMRCNSAPPPDLAATRRDKGITIEAIAGTTKIGSNYLRAIEEGEFEKLPGGLYNTSYIRQYARAIDYDEDALLQYYYRKTGTTPPGEPEGGTPGTTGKAASNLVRFPVLRFLP